MMAITHAAIATAGTSLILGTGNFWVLGLSVLGSQLPDLDTTSSVVGQVCFPLSSWLEDRFTHRTVTHSLIASFTIATLSIAIGIVLGDWKTLLALPIGHFLSCISDCFTVQGVQLFWPGPYWAVAGLNPKRRLVTGGTGEYMVLVVAVALLCGGVWLSNSGGVTQQVTQSLGLRANAIDLYNTSAATQQVWAQVKGVYGIDRSVADGKYLVIGTEGSEFILTDGEWVYKTGSEILASKVSLVLGDEAKLTTHTIQLDDQEIVAALRAATAPYPNSLIYLSGKVSVDLPNYITIDPSPGMETFQLTGSTVTLNHHPLEQTIVQLHDQYGIGTLQAEILYPRPTHAQP